MPREQRGTSALRLRAMSSLRRFSLSVSWKRILCIIFLPPILPGFAPRVKDQEDLIFADAQLQLAQYSMFNWSYLTPLKLMDRSVGLQTESRVGSKPYFTLGGHKFLIFGGSIHYFRVPREYWRDRLLKLKACGFNTLTTWLLQDPEMILRTTYKGFVEAVNKYFDHLISRIVPLQYCKRGPIIAVQVENEYGSFAEDKDYMPYIQKALLERGIVELLMTSDDAKHVLQGCIEGVLATINMNTFQMDDFKELSQVQRNKPIMVMEFWVGWFDTWGSEHMVKDAEDVEDTVSKFITSEISFNVYMFHGGTNFGFMNGATYFGKHRGVVTSYDYDAVLTEAGDYTEKYFKLRKLFGSLVAMHLPPLPKLSPKAEYPAVKPSLYLPLWDVLQYLNKPVISHTPVNMESLPINNGNGQSYGFVLYETSICSGGSLHANVQDTAQVFLNEKNIGLLGDDIKKLNIPEIKECQLLRILVENQGRVNFSWKIQDQRKGLTGPVTIDNIPLNGFIIYSLEMTMSFFERLRSASWRPVPKSYSGPAFYLGTLKAGSSPKDTFLRLLNWNYGFVFINGRNLGRYSIIGPQETLYLPGTWLHPKDNEIILFEKRKSGSYIQTIDEPKL
ncbi:beta-galactosidase-1-like protein 3 isoform X5 [Hyaena hyaena]|uniref:beta-galactosidase-1-like protein 3 isoform X5 n=1 Tax=Hyaena hyaena TaxID=95912 RepID=UPI0019224407|nr:beta-galactosidase-1-like protein 3 isoform X5 [Hyaena hyaena]